MEPPGNSPVFTVDPGAIAGYTVNLSSPQMAGSTFAVVVTAVDQFANRVTTDSSTPVTLRSSSDHVRFDGNQDGIFDDATKPLSAGVAAHPGFPRKSSEDLPCYGRNL